MLSFCPCHVSGNVVSSIVSREEARDSSRPQWTTKVVAHDDHDTGQLAAGEDTWGSSYDGKKTRLG